MSQLAAIPDSSNPGFLQDCLLYLLDWFTVILSDKLRGRKVGAALIARNISDHILDHFKVNINPSST